MSGGHQAAEVRRLSQALEEARADLAVLADAQLRLLEAEETLRAIRHGEVDALVVSSSPPGQQVFTLSSADRPYRIFVETMQEGAATLAATGTVLFANSRLGGLLGCPAAAVVARPMTDYVAEPDRPALLRGIADGAQGSTLELRLLRPDGRLVDTLVGVSRLDVDDEPLTCLTFTDLTAEHRLLREVRAREQQFEALYRGAPVPAHTFQDGTDGLVLISSNEAARRLDGGVDADLTQLAAEVHYRLDPELLADLQRCRSSQAVVERESVRRSGAAEQHLQVTMVPVPPDLVVVHTQDVTERWVAEQALRRSEARYRSIVENAQEGIGTLDAAGVFTFANRRIGELLGRPAASLVGLEAAALLRSSVPWALDAPGVASAQRAVTATRPDGSTLDLLVSTAPTEGPGGSGWLCMISDVTGLRQAEEELAHWAMHDALTGLPNRTLLMDRMAQALSRSQRHPGGVAALFCDLDGFKDINDGFGHHVGDEVLQLVAARLTAVLRPSDTVARIGGDEFVVLCQDLTDEDAACRVAGRVLDAVSVPARSAGHVLPLSMSIGVAYNGTYDAQELLRNADTAMYLAKQRGRNRAELFDEQAREVAAERTTLLVDLRQAVAQDELRVHYQPVFALDGEQLIGVEALVRWQHPRRGMVGPDVFIPLAESANLIGGIGAWVLGTACRQAAAWARAGAGGLPLHMAVNVSARQLASGSGLVELVAAALEESGIDPSTLVLEVTESAAMDDAEVTLDVLTALKALGVRLAIDDFGTGYSSLVYLKRFPVDQLKIDRTFVGGLGPDADDSAIVASVVSLAHAVGIVAIAEGVETREQLVALQRLGCGYGQGYLWSRPVPAEQLDELMRTGALGPPPAAPGQRLALAVERTG